jgi:hypothetical protein
MDTKHLNQNIFVFVFIGILILALIIVFILRFTVFKTGKYLVTAPQSELDSKGYGTYSTVFETGCLTASGKCSTSGVKYSTQYCNAHPTTGYGCLDQNGEMTFASQTITSNCLPNCRKYTLNNISGNTGFGPSITCQYSSTYASSDVTCVPINAKTFNYSIYSCNVNDAVGENACNYTCGSGGVTDAGIPGDSDPTLPSYIPSCVNKKGTIISLNSFPWQLRGNLPSKGVKISKGYTIFNYNTNGGTGPVSQNLFNIVPQYIPISTSDNPSPTGTGTISTEMLTDLDNKLVVYENCQIPNPKPYCGRRALYKPVQVESNLTNYSQSFPTTTPPNIQQTAACYVDPYWNSSPVAPYNSNSLNPYTGTVGATGISAPGYTIFSGIGQYGYTYEVQSCIDSATVPTLQGSTGGVNIYTIPPPYQSSISCTALTVSTGATGSATTCLNDPNYIPTNIPYNTNLNICNTVFPDGAPIPGTVQGSSIQVPGTVVNCQYMPNNDQLNYYINSTTQLDPALQNLLGNYIQIYTNSGSDKYVLSLLTSPCGTGTFPTQQIPLANCSLISPITSLGYEAEQPCCFVYNGGTGATGAYLNPGAYWGKSNCDSEMIELTNALNIIVSPRTYVSSTELTCDLYAYFGKVFGQLTTRAINTVASGLLFTPLLPSQYKDKSKYLYEPFTIKYTGGQVIFQTSRLLNILDIFAYAYDGNVLNPPPPLPSAPTYPYPSGGLSFNISGAPPFANEIRTLPFNGPITKTNGIYVGDNVSTSLNLQRGNPCYYNKCDPSAPDENNNPCFPNTCNLYYEYNAEIC